MAFGKRFPKDVPGSNFPEWVEITLTKEEEKQIEHDNRIANLRLMAQAIDDSKKIFEKKGLKAFQSDIISAAISLFERQASHNVHAKEARLKEKFDSKKI